MCKAVSFVVRPSSFVLGHRDANMRIAIITPEAAPFAKTGGLADVAGSLPKALFRLGHEPILIMPFYRGVQNSNIPLTTPASLSVPMGRRAVEAQLRQGQIPGTEAPVYFINNAAFFDRDGLYGKRDTDYADNCERFVFLARGAVEAVSQVGFAADAFHLHDWQTALVAPYLRILYADDPVLGRAGCLLTIHNMAHQGIFARKHMDTLGLGWEYFNWKQLEFWGKVNLLKAGIVFSDVTNTVSPTYAEEIQTPQYGHGLEGVLHERSDMIHGVVNGIDDAVWNPAGDPHLTATYGPENLQGKAKCKRALQRQSKLPQRKVPLAGIVSRLAEQKGLDIAVKALDHIMEKETLQCVVLGDGDNRIKDLLEALQKRHPDKFRVFVKYDNHLAHRIFAAADMILVPSRFEPCGLTQLYGLKYGSVPIVRQTGGLADTVCNCTPETLAAGRATGFTFERPTPQALEQCLHRALALYRDCESWRRLVETGMAQDWSWEVSAIA